MKLKLGILAKDIALYKICGFYSSRIRTLVAMTTYSFIRLIMGKEEIGNFYCLIGDNRILFLQKCLLAHLSRRLIGELLVYRGIRRPSVVNIFKRLLL